MSTPRSSGADDLFALALPVPWNSTRPEVTSKAAKEPAAKGKKADAVANGVHCVSEDDDEFQSRTVHCRDCGRPFTFSAQHQRSLVERGFKAEKTRCEECSDYKKNRFGPKRRADHAVPPQLQHGKGGGKGEGKGRGKGRGKGGGKGKGKGAGKGGRGCGRGSGLKRKHED